jgi:signal transduction histidine kinase
MKEFNLVTQQGRQIAISWVFSPMRDHLDQVTGVVAVGRDLTERREFEEQLLQSQKLAALGVMAGGIAHEIRNPLSICSSASQFLMEDGITDEFRRENADKIYKGVQRASVIIENLLKFAHPSLRTSPVQINLLSLIKETVTLVAYQAKVKKVEIKTDFPDDPVSVKGTADLLQQVFMNLFLNAVNSMPDGGMLEVSVNIKDKEIYICVKDTGIGIPKNSLDKVFDPFYTTSVVGKGTGLGLSLCYSIIKQHDGLIDVESVEGKGSTFIVRLPK